MMEFCWNFGFQISQFFWKKKPIVLQNLLIKPRIYTIKQHKNFKFFSKTKSGKIENKDVKNTKKLKRQIINDGIQKMFCI